MDESYSNEPVINGGFKRVMVSFDRKSHIIHIEHRSKHKSLVSHIKNSVSKYGIPDRILADHVSHP